MSKFAQVKQGLLADISARSAVAADERARWKKVMAQVPESRKKMAIALLGDPRVGRYMSDEEIVRTCNFGHSSEGESHSAQQALFAQGVQDAARLLNKPVPTNIPVAYPATAHALKLDPALFAAGEAMARELKPFMMNAR